MMKNKIIVGIIVAIVALILIFGVLICFKTENKETNVVAINDVYTEIDKNQISYQENVDVDELKQDAGKTGNSDIYEVQTEFDGRKILQVKAGLKYKVAFAGMIKNSKPSNSELDDIYSKNMPSNTGIWIEIDSRNKILEYFNNTGLFESKYEVDGNGFLKVVDDSNFNEYDSKVKSIINGDKLFIFDVSSVCYIVDDISGEFLDYDFEKMDKYQTYEYFDDDDKMIIFINENKSNQMSDMEIFESVINLL